MVNTIEDLKSKVEEKKRDNTPVGESIDDRYDAVATPGVVGAFIEECWGLIPNIRELEEKKFAKLAFDIDRSLHSYKNINEAMANFKSLNLSESSNELYPFTDAEFSIALKNKLIFRDSIIATNFQLQLATSSMHNIPESQKEKLYNITAEMLAGAISKNGLSSIDSAIVNEQGRANPYFTVAVIKYIDDNFAILKDLDATKLNLIGLELKNAYKDAVGITSDNKVRGVFEDNETEKIASAFKAVDATQISSRSIVYSGFKSYEFSAALQKANKLFTKEIADNIKEQLSSVEVTSALYSQSREFYETTANLLVGIVTNKGISRSIDSEVIGSDNKMDSNLAAAIGKYANDHFKKLESCNKKTQRFIGGFLKEEYKKVKTQDPLDIEKAINSIPPDVLVEAKENMPSGFLANLTGASHPREIKKIGGLARQ